MRRLVLACQLRPLLRARLRTFRLLFFPLFRNKMDEYESRRATCSEYFAMYPDGYFTVDEVIN